MCLGRQLLGSSIVFLVVLLPFRASDGAILIGSWGGDHIALVATDTGARVELDCALGHIAGPLHADESGAFEVGGSYVPEEGGPTDLTKPPRVRSLAVRYKGWTDGERMQLTIIVPESGRALGIFSLCLGCRPRLEKCL